MNLSRRMIGVTVFGMALLVSFPMSASATTVRASLSGFAEVPSSISTEASGSFRAKIRLRSQQLEYRLSYSGFDSPVRFAHIHFSRPATNGGIAVWLCDNMGNGPDGTPPCPQGSGTVEDVVGTDDVVGPASQGLEAGDFEALVDAIFAGATYVNVHSDNFGGGEIRGNIRRGLGDRDDD